MKKCQTLRYIEIVYEEYLKHEKKVILRNTHGRCLNAFVNGSQPSRVGTALQNGKIDTQHNTTKQHNIISNWTQFTKSISGRRNKDTPSLIWVMILNDHQILTSINTSLNNLDVAWNIWKQRSSLDDGRCLTLFDKIKKQYIKNR